MTAPDESEVERDDGDEGGGESFAETNPGRIVGGWIRSRKSSTHFQVRRCGTNGNEPWLVIEGVDTWPISDATLTQEWIVGRWGPGNFRIGWVHRPTAGGSPKILGTSPKIWIGPKPATCGACGAQVTGKFCPGCGASKGTPKPAAAVEVEAPSAAASSLDSFLAGEAHHALLADKEATRAEARAERTIERQKLEFEQAKERMRLDFEQSKERDRMFFERMATRDAAPAVDPSAIANAVAVGVAQALRAAGVGGGASSAPSGGDEPDDPDDPEEDDPAAGDDAATGDVQSVAATVSKLADLGKPFIEPVMEALGKRATTWLEGSGAAAKAAAE